MKRFFLLCGLLAGLVLPCSAQTTAAARELGVQFSSFTGFSVIYKKQRSENRYIRFRAVFTALDLDVIDDETDFSLSVGGRVGFERRKALNDRLYVLFGPELGVGVGLQSASGTQDPPYNLNASIGYVLGMQHNFGQHFFIGLETVPALTVSYQDRGTPDPTIHANLGFNSLASISTGFRF